VSVPATRPSAPSAPVAAAARGLALPRTLRGKGLLAMAAALVYALAAALYLTSLRGGLQADVEALDRLHKYERALAKAEVAVSGASLEVQEATFAPMLTELTSVRAIALAVEGAQRALEGLVEHNPGAERSVRAVRRAQEALEAQPVRANWIDLRDALRRVQEEVAIERDRTALQRQSVAEGYQSQFDAVTRRSFVLMLAGVAAFAALVIVFFTRMTRDIARLQVRASEIVRGERRPPLAVTRDDELGQLTQAVNAMADDLDARARQLLLEQQRSAHQEKMATLGALAASVAHEVNNPLMTITLVAQELAATDGGLSADDTGQRARVLLSEVHRLANVTRQISAVAASRDGEQHWLDLNALLRPTLQFFRYDKRYRGIEFSLALDPQLPAARAAADPVELIVLRLLNEVAGALAAGRRPTGRITVATRAAAAGPAVEVEVAAADVPMAGAAGIERAIDICQSIAGSLGGRLEAVREGGNWSLRLRLATVDTITEAAAAGTQREKAEQQ